MRILMADDDAVLRHGLRIQLQRWGYDPVICANGDDARAALAEGNDPPLVAILDRSMPGVDGLTLCGEIRSTPRLRATYVVLLTAHDSRQDIVSGLEGGADEYMTKPFDWEMLRARLRTGVRIATLQRELASKVTELEEALRNVKQLSGLLPMCSYCKRIRDDQDYWQQLETYLSDHSEAEFSHGVCPPCLERVRAEFEA
ncbi:MAG TPA: response regulator transcription factor [Casimicrobiaceae bacterium]